MYASIEEQGLSMKLYNRFKRAGLNQVKDFSTYPFEKLTKLELIELIENYAVYDESGTDSIEEFGCSDELYQALKKQGVQTISIDMEKLNLQKLNKKNLVEILQEFGDFLR